ncbi:Alpha-ketoglutarate-dependent 2,4-dichlorophenoxyacetate dioxygenase [Lachnellula suecica]|uniref:Alpha-ketoglutarate-dependent 2,4-dichlorophenoxyacetate dioxygenase n=1 Tax=Lachnellula suecica TaxID=602035 RepID=A0A8T9C7N8_9HELO|nr:Alpha-ketoglutarate-dependent 2,4-dichlorophenoxyacetate dioxygenase [Lachnellula suecica]
MSAIFTTTYENTCPARPSTGVLKLIWAHEPIKYGSLVVRPVMVSKDSAFGAEVSGVEWSHPVPSEMVKQLVEVSKKYAVLIFRETGFDNAGHIAFSQQLGDELEINPFYWGRENDRVGEPFLWDVTSSLTGRWSSGTVDGGTTDSSFHQHRSKYSILLSHGNPAAGGSWTHFADTRRAYADLPQDKKDELEDLVVEHDLWHSRKLGSPTVYLDPTPQEQAAKPPAYHRLVQVAPDGRKTLYLAAHAKIILGRSFADSQKLIWDLIDHCTQAKYVFSMEWLSGGDMVWWDNSVRQSMHRANPYTDEMTARDVRRTTIIDDGPLAFGVKANE